MANSSREKILLMIVIVSVLLFGGSYAYQSFGDNMWLQQNDIEEQQEAIDTMLDKQRDSGSIIKRYAEMMEELVVEGDNSEQQLAVLEQITAILQKAGLKGNYKSLSSKDPIKEPDFKILMVTVEDIECTPQQLGILLNLIEKQSEVMEVTRSSITNIIRDNGEIYGRRDEFENNPSLTNGLLSIDLEISRLVEYRKDEERPKKNTRRRGR